MQKSRKIPRKISSNCLDVCYLIFLLAFSGNYGHNNFLYERVRIVRMINDIRWKQRLENFGSAFMLLKEAFKKDPSEMSDLEKEEVVQRFEYTFELAWKTLKDYLVYSGVVFDQITPRSVIKQAFAAKIVKDGQIWIDMLEQRNLISHTYDSQTFEAVFKNISQNYVDALEQVITWLREKALE